MRISGSLVVILVVFLLTAILVKVDMAPQPFFTLTMIKIICINCEFLARPQKCSVCTLPLLDVDFGSPPGLEGGWVLWLEPVAVCIQTTTWFR